jgi:hypothetical protein
MHSLRQLGEAVCPRPPTHFVVADLLNGCGSPSAKNLLIQKKKSTAYFHSQATVKATLPRTYERKMKQLGLEQLVFASQKLRHTPQIQ